MQEWILKPGMPLALTLAADARTANTDYYNDQIWEVTVGRGEPAAISVQTTYGLRARNMRIFPRLFEGETLSIDPANFPTGITVQKYFPNYLRIFFSPLEELEAILEYWVPSSQALSARFRLVNKSLQERSLQVEWAAMLFPTPGGQRTAEVEIQGVTVLSGSSANLAPVFFITGGATASSSPYPALITKIELEKGGQYVSTWVQSALADAESSFVLAREIARRNWDAEIARLEMLNASQVEIMTGNPKLDRVFDIAQTLAYQSFQSATLNLPCPSFVSTRSPDQGYSLRGNGSDYNHLWNGQTSQEAYALSQLILPAGSDFAIGLLENFLSTQDDTGMVDWKPGLGGQRSQMNAIPLLANLAWTIYAYTQSKPFLEKNFPALLQFWRSWFLPQHDRDQDGLPEWSHPYQAGLEDHPLYTRWRPQAQGIDPTAIEGPDLSSWLYHEGKILERIARLLDLAEPLEEIAMRCQRLQEAVEMHWEDEASIYHYWDRDSHLSMPSLDLLIAESAGDSLLNQTFDSPVRLLFCYQANDEMDRQIQIFIHGTGPTGGHRIERLATETFRWVLNTGHCTGEHLYTHIELITVAGLHPGEELKVKTVGHHAEDITSLLPLWAGIPDAKRAKQLIKKTILNPKRFWHPCGLPTCIPGKKEAETAPDQDIHLFWNSLVAEGLLAYGYRDAAAELTQRLLDLCVNNLERQGAFQPIYHSQNGRGRGERNAILGLPPLGLFLATMGIRILNPWEVLIQGNNPYPWPITVKYRGLTVLRHKEKTTVIFPDGQTISSQKTNPHLISMALNRSLS